jgi:coenzyme F420-reducing hydrogenase gamma subunit
MTVVLGKDGSAGATDKTLFIGECAKKMATEHCFLNGCPPTKEEVFEFLKENLQ